MSPNRRRFMQLGMLATLGGVARGDRETDVPEGSQEGVAEEQPQSGPGTEVTVKQDEGEAFYWVLPGERRLSPTVFGTPENPRFGSDLLETRIEQAKELPMPLCDAIPQLLEDLPFLVAAPEEARAPIDDDGVAREKLTVPTLYSDEARVTSGAFEITYADRQPYDLPGAPGDTEDTVELDAQFTDPAGNEYELEFDHVVQPPIPGYQTGGGVLTSASHHGITGTGSPLMPEVFTYGACWGVGNVIINGEVATTDGFRVIHFMTTQTIRDRNYQLAIGEELPLMPDETIAGQSHHSHAVVLPIRPTPNGPVFDPVPTAFELPTGGTQPFIHAMWEQDEVVEGPFAEWEFPTGNEDEEEREEASDADFELGGNTPGWEGVAPTAIEGETNPLLELEAEVEYTLAWENLDGLPHNFVIENGNGDDIVRSEIISEEGAIQEVTFTATEEMTEYYCEVHPESMRGSVEITG